MEELTDMRELNGCTMASTEESRWKEATQRYIANMLLRNLGLRTALLNGTYRESPTIRFTINERGHIRDINAPACVDRPIQKSVSRNVLIPAIRPHLIYDNYASLKDRGTHFARRRFVIMLRRYIRANGTDGYVLLGDISKYFDSVDHEVLKQQIAPLLKDQPADVIALIYQMIDSSSESDKGLNLGGEPPQILAVGYLGPIDTYVKVVKGVKYYGRYMDDFFVIGRSKEELKNLLTEIGAKTAELRLSINDKKTHIVKLRHVFVWLQTKYVITETGGIRTIPTRGKLLRERRRLKALRRLVDKGRMTTYEAWMAYKSWRGSVMTDYNSCFRALRRMDAVFWQLFPVITHPKPENRHTVAADIWKDLEPMDLKTYCLTD